MSSSKFIIVVGLAIFLIGYLIGSEIEKIKIQNKLDIITDRINTIDSKLFNFSSSIELKQNGLLNSMTKLNDQVQSLNLQKVSVLKKEPLKINDTAQNNEIELTDLTYDELIDKLKGSDLSERQNIIESIMKEGTPEIKKQIIALALNENTDKNIRYTAIEKINWEGHGNELVDMVNNTPDINAIGSALEAAKKSTFNPNEAQLFKESLTKLFQQNRDDVPQAAIIDYFKNEGTSDLNNFLNQIRVETLPVELQQYIELVDVAPPAK